VIFLLQIKGNVGATEVFMGRFYGMTLLSSCFTWYKTKGSLDATVPLTVMLSRLFVSCFCNIIAAKLIALTGYIDMECKNETIPQQS